MKTQLNVFMPLPLTERGPAYTCGMLAQGMADSTLGVTVVTPRARTISVAPASVVQVLPRWARRLPYRWVRQDNDERLNQTFLSQFDTAAPMSQAAYIWPDMSLEAIKRLKQKGVTTFREMINCHRATAKAILDEAYHRVGVPPSHGITELSAIAEQKALEAVDYIFCPNPQVEASLIANGIPSGKLIGTSYGWDPGRFPVSPNRAEPDDKVTFLFVGSLNVRKGCHLLLDYWARSKINGRLVLAGQIDDIIKERCAPLLAREDVEVLGYVPNVAALFRKADVFVFPTLEEGGPQVTYEACGCALPVITTPMGAGRIVRDGREGIIRDAYDANSWISALCMLAEDHHMRRRFSLSANQRAGMFKWNRVAQRRREHILSRLPAQRISHPTDEKPIKLRVV